MRNREEREALVFYLIPVQISQFYSHLNGYEHILVHQHSLWQEIENVISAVDAASCLTKVSLEKTKKIGCSTVL